MKRNCIILIIVFIPLLTVAQNKNLIKFNYLPSISLGETAEFTQNMSFRGFEFEADKYISESVSLGFSLGWNVFREKVTGESLEYRDLLITGNQYRYTNIVPMKVHAKMYFGSSDLTTFVGFGVGSAYTKQTNNMGIFAFIDEAWQVHISPELGIQSWMSPDYLISLKLKYGYTFKAGKIPNMSYLGLGLGIGIF